MWRKAMLYLGLGPDEDYDDYDVLANGAQPAPSREPIRRPVATPHHDHDPSGSVRTLSAAAAAEVAALQHAAGVSSNGHSARSATDRERPVGRERERFREPERDRDRDREPGSARARPSVVRPLSVASAKPHVVAPASFADAQEVADEFKRNVPVIVNLQGVDRDLMRRIIDFSSGLCYGLSGNMERVANHVYLLTPSDVEVSAEERRRWRDRGDA
ncbi:MAG TPA: cell division protein SepF [Acidimicrobiales bacterium]